MNELTLKQMSKIAHALGINLFHAAMSHKLKDKKLPQKYYRNYFQVQQNEVFEELIKLGCAGKSKSMDLPYYFITEKGIRSFENQFNKTVKYKSPKDRDLPYLRERINWYSGYCGYRFCDDNSEHIISAYLNYWVKGYYVSHTTKDVIIKFKNELHRYFKKGLLPA